MRGAFNSNYCIDAFTGEKINTGSQYYPYSYGDASMYKNMEVMQAKSMGGGIGPSLSDEEIKAIEKVSALIKTEEAERRARSMATLGLNDGFKLQSSSLIKDWSSNDDFIWQLNFIAGTEGEGKNYRTVSTGVDAKTGEIKSFYIHTPDSDQNQPVYDEKSSKAAVDKFLMEFKADKYSQLVYDDSSRADSYTRDGKLPNYYNFRYYRLVNGIQYPGNYVNVNFNTVTGKVTSFDMIWNDTTFPPIDKVVPTDEIYKKLFSDIGLRLEYRPIYSNARSALGKIMPGNTSTPVEIKLVYGVNPQKPLNFDAYTGNILNYNGEPYKEVKPSEYADISGHYAEKEIKILAQYGMISGGKTFRPDEAITQLEFLKIVAKSMNYYGAYTEKEMDGTAMDNLYRYLIREGIVRDGEKSPQSLLTREEGVKFVIRALKFDKVADIKGIYSITFEDSEQISPDLIGYIAIAKGLGIISGSEGYFYPANRMTRAQAAVIIYNYLKN